MIAVLARLVAVERERALDIASSPLGPIIVIAGEGMAGINRGRVLDGATSPAEFPDPEAVTAHLRTAV